MRRDPRHWEEFYRDADAGTQGLKRAFSLSDRCRYYWPVPAVREARERLLGNLVGRRVPRGLLGQHFPDAEGAFAGDEPDLPERLERLRVRRVLDRYARACRPAPVSNGPRFP
jgi:D-tagatose-1,6-bisphosphate aldolase subunit GatZ/KbaZ